MRIDRIGLSWFRGAADPVALETGGKSVVVYGQNGSGKSSFVDAVEYILRDGKIDHLAHEYSGRRQEKGLLNTHRPEDRTCELRITLQDSSELKVQIQPDGKPSRSTKGSPTIEDWDYRSTILRQHEVAGFIHGTKGDKYSTLLPLLGLHSFELLAENLDNLAGTMAGEADLSAIAMQRKRVATQREDTFGSATDEEIAKTVEALRVRYCPDKPKSTDLDGLSKTIDEAVQNRIDSSTADHRRHVALQDLGGIEFKSHIASVRSANATLAKATERLVRERVKVLQAARALAADLTSSKEVPCPACGRSLPGDEFRKHVEDEHSRLAAIIETTEARAEGIQSLVQSVGTLQRVLEKTDLTEWKDTINAGPKAALLTSAATFDVHELRNDCTEALLTTMEQKLVPLVELAKDASQGALPEAVQLQNDKREADTAAAVFRAAGTAPTAVRAQELVDLVRAWNGVSARRFSCARRRSSIRSPRM